MTWTQPYADMPEGFAVEQLPEGPAAGHVPELVFWNETLAAELGLELEAEVWSGARVPAGTRPVALAYAGHQFGHLAMLGDGRAVLIGGREAREQVMDVQLKGSGRTPFARGGDGRAALGPMLREALFSEAMHALGVPTTRTLAVATTGREVHRPGLPPAWSGPGAVLTRVASSHLRVGTFVLASNADAGAVASGADPAHLRAVADCAIARHDPDLTDQPGRYGELLRRIVRRQAGLVARWMSLGFVHGVLNTDNVAVSGETIDYGPCAFLDRFDSRAVFSAIDRQGRYAYGRQPEITGWNLGRLAESMLPLLATGRGEDAAVDEAQAALDTFVPQFADASEEAYRLKLGLDVAEPPLVGALLEVMEAGSLDYTGTFRQLADAEVGALPHALQPWAERWAQREPDRTVMRGVNPTVIPRSHHVEAVLEDAVVRDDLTGFDSLLTACRRPFEVHPRWSTTPGAAAPTCTTHCGT